jgi:hypothetical protein
MTEKTAESAGGSNVRMWLGGGALGLAVGAVIWLLVLGPMARQEAPETAAGDAASATDASGEAAPAATAAPVGDIAAMAPTAEAPAATEPPATEPVDTATAEPAPIAPPATAGSAVASATALSDAAALQFDTVRAEADGSAVVAGRAAPGQSVSIISDGVAVAEAVADGRGQFVALLSLGASAVPRVLTLAARGVDGAVQSSEQSVILVPRVAEAASAELAEVATGQVESAAAEPAVTAVTGATQTETTEAPAEATPAPTAEPTAVEPAPAAPDVLIADADGVRKLAPVAVSGIIIDTISYSTTGEVLLTGRGAPGLTARIYLDNTFVLEVPIGDDGIWTSDMPGVAAGRYALRVDQVDAGGKVAARFETPFQREAPEVVAASAAQATKARSDGATPPPSAEATATPPADPSAAAALATPESAPVPDAGAATTPGAEPAAAQPAIATPQQELPATRVTAVTVQPGFTLWRIARENLGEGMLYVQVYEANKDQIRDPDLIYPGQIFTVPEN